MYYSLDFVLGLLGFAPEKKKKPSCQKCLSRALRFCLMYELGHGDAPALPWYPKRRVDETRQSGGLPALASGFFLFLPFGNK